MRRSYISLGGLVTATGFLSATGTVGNKLPRPNDAVKIANAALQTKNVAGEWTPAVGDSWNYNLALPVDTTVDVDVVMIDMDAGQDVIDELHNNGKWVVCYINIGAIEEWRSDYEDFPEEAIGSPLEGWPDEYWLDVNNEDIKPIMTARVEMAQSMNCDGVEPDNMDVYLQTNPGVTVTVEEQIAYNTWFAAEVQSYGMKVALKNCVDILSELVDAFDFAINEECYEFDECNNDGDGYGFTFLAQGKPVFNVEYTDNLDMCDYTNELGIDTIIKDYALNAEFCSCVDPSRNLDCELFSAPTPAPVPSVCGDDVICDDPHMTGLRGQKIDWSGVNGGWYSLIKDSKADLHINIRLTAPLPEEFPNRQLVTGVSVLAAGHSLAIEVKNPYTTATDGCPTDVSPCLANGGLRAVVDGYDVEDLLHFSRRASVAGNTILVSASNLPVECRQFGGDKIWARMYDEMLQGQRSLTVEDERLEDWILSSHKMAAPEWCTKYIVENDLADLQSPHAIFKIETPTTTVRLSAGMNYQGGGELDWDGRVLPDLEFWQMDVGLDGLDVDNPLLSGILGETARPVYDKETGREVMEGFEAFRGGVEDYRVAGSLGTHFALLGETEGLGV